MWHVAMLALSFMMALGSTIGSLRGGRRSDNGWGGLTRLVDVLLNGSRSCSYSLFCFCLFTSIFIWWGLKILVWQLRIGFSVDPICSRVISCCILILMLHGGAYGSTLRNQRLQFYFACSSRRARLLQWDDGLCNFLADENTVLAIFFCLGYLLLL